MEKEEKVEHVERVVKAVRAKKHVKAVRVVREEKVWKVKKDVEEEKWKVVCVVMKHNTLVEKEERAEADVERAVRAEADVERAVRAEADVERAVKAEAVDVVNYWLSYFNIFYENYIKIYWYYIINGIWKEY